METKEQEIKNKPQPSEEKDTVHHEKAGLAASNEQVEEIDLADLAKQIWQKRKVMIYTTIIAFLLGIFVAVFSPEEYEASVVLMPQAIGSGSGVNAGLLRQFGGLAGINLDHTSASGTLSPTLYPEITNSTPFFLYIMKEEVYFSTLDTTLAIESYFSELQKPGVLDYTKKYTIGLPKVIIGLPAVIINSLKDKPKTNPAATTANKSDAVAADSLAGASGDHPIQVTGREMKVIRNLESRIETSIESNGTVKVSVEMPDPLVAAKTTELAVNYLTNYIREYRTEKAQQDLAFIEKQYNEKKEKYNIAQQRLARFQDRNTNIFTESARIELERLKTENNLAFSLYQGLAQQLEQAKIKVQEETPAFKVLEPIQVPLGNSKPNKELIITLSLFIGAFIGFAIVFFQILYLNLKSKIL